MADRIPGRARVLLRDHGWWCLGFAGWFLVHLAALLVYNRLTDPFPPAELLDRGVWAYAVLLAMVLGSTDEARRRMACIACMPADSSFQTNSHASLRSASGAAERRD